jgi:hypothetical protein
VCGVPGLGRQRGGVFVRPKAGSFAVEAECFGVGLAGGVEGGSSGGSLQLRTAVSGMRRGHSTAQLSPQIAGRVIVSPGRTGRGSGWYRLAKLRKSQG